MDVHLRAIEQRAVRGDPEAIARLKRIQKKAAQRKLSFEETLQVASADYMHLLQQNPTEEQVDELFSRYFAVLGVGERGKNLHTVTLPGLDLWNKQHPGQESPFWHEDSSSTAHKNRYPKGCGKDGLVYVTFRSGEEVKKRGRTYVEVRFKPYLEIPKNSVESDNLCVPYSAEGSLLDHVWVRIDGWTSETQINLSPYGTIRSLSMQSFGRFLRSTAHDTRDQPEMLVNIRQDDPYVRSVTLRLPEGNEPPSQLYRDEMRYEGAPLGDGTLTAFLKHMRYDGLDQILK